MPTGPTMPSDPAERIPRCQFPAAQSTQGNCRLTPPGCDRTDAPAFPEREITVNISRAAQHGRLRPQRSRLHASGITLKEQAAMIIPDASTCRERPGSDAEADRRPVTRTASAPARRATLSTERRRYPTRPRSSWAAARMASSRLGSLGRPGAGRDGPAGGTAVGGRPVGSRSVGGPAVRRPAVGGPARDASGPTTVPIITGQCDQ